MYLLTTFSRNSIALNQRLTQFSSKIHNQCELIAANREITTQLIKFVSLFKLQRWFNIMIFKLITYRYP